MHVYYREFDWLSDAELEEELPEGEVPPGLVIHDLEDEESEQTTLTCEAFQEWLWEGRFDCDVAQAFLRLWTSGGLRGSDSETLADFYRALLLQYREDVEMAAAGESAESAEAAERDLPVAYISALLRKYGRAPFDCAGLDDEAVETRLTADIFGEVAAVQAYVASWRGSTAIAPPDRHTVSETVRQACEEVVQPWPTIEKQPAPIFEEGRFAKSFPLEFPMGVGDLYQTQLRDDFTTPEWVQHKFRYHTGQYVSSARGHRVTWALMNTLLQEAARKRGGAFHKRSAKAALTKGELREMLRSDEELVHHMAAFGAEIPTTPMFWKRQTTELQWIVKQMSWTPPWLSTFESPDVPVAETAAGSTPTRAAASVGQPQDCAAAENDDEAREDAETDSSASDVASDARGEARSAAEDSDWDVHVGLPPAPHPAKVWSRSGATSKRGDDYGYGRHPALWYTLNCPYNYLHEIHRFQDPATGSLGGADRGSRRARAQWCFDNPDIVCYLHVLRTELMVRMVMPAIVPNTPEQPWLYWLRFEEGPGGNPHGHGVGYAAGNPSFGAIEDAKAQALDPEAAADAVGADLASYFSEIATEWHPAKDEQGDALYDFYIEHLDEVDLACPQTINLKELLDEALGPATQGAPNQEGPAPECDLSKIKRVLLALIEDGQRHTLHGHGAPKLGIHPCARKLKRDSGETSVICRYNYPRELLSRVEAALGKVLEDPLRRGLYNLFLARNDQLLNGFEEHVLLANLGNVDWRPLINLWAVLAYLTKYCGKPGKSTRHLGTLFDSVLADICQYEREDGQLDLWRRTIMKFYNRILGDRDYTLFEVTRVGLRLPPVLSSFGDVFNASLSEWRALRSSWQIALAGPEESVESANKVDLFDVRGTLRRPSTISEADLCNLSFYGFWRQYYYYSGSLHRRQKERFLSLSATGHPEWACRSHPKHEFYARQALRAYAPCPGLAGLGYLEGAVSTWFGNSWGAFLQAFVEDAEHSKNCWCPTWVLRNYKVCNEESDGEGEEGSADEKPARASETAETTGAEGRKRSPERDAVPHKPRKSRWVFEDDVGEPPVDAEEEAATTLDQWQAQARAAWQEHSELGPNLDPAGRGGSTRPWMSRVNPPDFDWCARWPDVDVHDLRRQLEERRDQVVAYSRPDLTRDKTQDDFQRLFVELMLKHVDDVLANWEHPERVRPVRLLLLGTAGTGKTTTLKIFLQELQMLLARQDFKGDFCRVAAPTGCAAFNIRFEATTVHRLFELRNPRKFEALAEGGSVLQRLQQKLQRVRLVVFDEISMVGRKLMGKVSARCLQARPARENPEGDRLGRLSFVGVGDPAQCPPISDEPLFDSLSHKDTLSDPTAPRVTLSNVGKLVYDSFDEVIILPQCHRLTFKEGDDLTAEDLAYNERAQRFLEVVTRLRDCDWTPEDYYWLSRRKLSHLSLAERASFADAPMIMEFRKERADEAEDETVETCEAYNRRALYALAQESKAAIAHFAARYEGVSAKEGAAFEDEVFFGLSHELDLCEEAPVLLTKNEWVSAGWMNGTRGIIRALVYRDGDRPDHEDPARQLPAVVLVECPDFIGAPFFDPRVYPERAKWVPVFPSRVECDQDRNVARTQLFLVLAWALTPWKAQGMSLQRARLHIDRTASKPGVAFTALTRLRHPDGLALDDCFPAMSVFQRQKLSKSFQQRQRFERLAAARFSGTIRRHMREPELYSDENRWSAEDAACAEALLDFTCANRDLDLGALPAAFVTRQQARLDRTETGNDDVLDSVETWSSEIVDRVWARLTRDWPHSRAVALARGRLFADAPADEVAAAEKLAAAARAPVTQVKFQGWSVPLSDLEAFVRDSWVSPALFELFAKCLRSAIFTKHPGLQQQGQGRAASTRPSCAIANAKTCASARQAVARLRALVPLGRAALLPLRSALRKVWAAYRVQAVPDEPAASHLCLASYWGKMSMEERDALQATITTVWPRCRFTFQVWEFPQAYSYLVPLYVTVAETFHADTAVQEEHREKFKRVADEVHTAMWGFCDAVFRDAQALRKADVLELREENATVADAFDNCFGWTRSLTWPAPPAASPAPSVDRSKQRALHKEAPPPRPPAATPPPPGSLLKRRFRHASATADGADERASAAEVSTAEMPRCQTSTLEASTAAERGEPADAAAGPKPGHFCPRCRHFWKPGDAPPFGHCAFCPGEVELEDGEPPAAAAPTKSSWREAAVSTGVPPKPPATDEKALLPTAAMVRRALERLRVAKRAQGGTFREPAAASGSLTVEDADVARAVQVLDDEQKLGDLLRQLLQTCLSDNEIGFEAQARLAREFRGMLHVLMSQEPRRLGSASIGVSSSAAAMSSDIHPTARQLEASTALSATPPGATGAKSTSPGTPPADPPTKRSRFSLPTKPAAAPTEQASTALSATPLSAGVARSASPPTPPASPPTKRSRFSLSKTPAAARTDASSAAAASKGRVYFLSIQPQYEALLKEGRKTVEARVRVGDAAKVREGDVLVLGSERRRVLRRHQFAGFREMLKEMGLQRTLPSTVTLDQGLKIYHGFRNYETDAKLHGVVAFELGPETAPTSARPATDKRERSVGSDASTAGNATTSPAATAAVEATATNAAATDSAAATAPGLKRPRFTTVRSSSGSASSAADVAGAPSGSDAAMVPPASAAAPAATAASSDRDDGVSCAAGVPAATSSVTPAAASTSPASAAAAAPRAPRAPDTRPRTFINGALRCFINASLQALFAVPPVCAVLQQLANALPEDVSQRLRAIATALVDRKAEDRVQVGDDEARLAITYEVAREGRNTRNMFAFLLLHKHYNDAQEDAHEFLQRVLHTGRSPTLSAVMQGVDMPMRLCPQCPDEQPLGVRPEPFTCWSLPILRAAGEPLLTTQAAVDAFLEPELLDEDYAWQCETCGCTERPSKRVTLLDAPNVLWLQLKRWRYESVVPELVPHQVQADEVLTILDHVYFLRALIVHQGATARGGHYYAVCYHAHSDGSWWLYNDTTRRLARAEDLAANWGRKLYICFYERRVSAVQPPPPALPYEPRG